MDRPRRRWIATALVVGVLVLALPWDSAAENRREGLARTWRHSSTSMPARMMPWSSSPITCTRPWIAIFRATSHVFPIHRPDNRPGPGESAPAGLAGYDAVWLVQSHYEKAGPEQPGGRSVRRRFPEVTEIYLTGIVIHEYMQHYRMPTVPAGVLHMNVTLGNLRLLGCAYAPEALPAHEETLHPPSNWVHVAAYWTPAGQVSGDSLPEARLVDGSGQVWGDRLDRPGDTYHVWPPARG